MNRRAVLIVDDDAALAENVAEILEPLGTERAVASSGRAAIEEAPRLDPDVVLLDLRLPDADGLDLISRLHAIVPDAAVILLTGDATLESAIAAVRGGAFAYVTKPFSPAELLATVRRGLDRVALAKERERLRVELQDSEARHRELVEAMPAFVLALDEEHRIMVWNRRLEEVTGHKREERLGTPGADIVGQGGERPLPVRGGAPRIVRWQRATVPAGGAAWTYAVGIDVTDEKEMLSRTLRAERLAAVGTLAAGLAHEVRNPLNSAALQLSVLERRVDRGEPPASIHAVASLVRSEIERLDHLVSDFLAFVQPRPPARQSLDLGELVRTVLQLVGPQAEAAHVVVRRTLDPSLPLLPLDPDRMRQVLLNLLRNAIEAMPEGGTLTVRTRAAGDSVELDVADSGLGFDGGAPVFDAFFTTKPQGTGLGLAIVHRVVTDHQGTIRVTSEPGNTCFTISLPRA